MESDEYAEITNLGGQTANLSGWRLNAGDPGQDFWFPSFTLAPGQSCRVYTTKFIQNIVVLALEVAKRCGTMVVIVAFCIMLVEEKGKSVQELRIDANFEYIFDSGDIINDMELQAEAYVLINRDEEELFALDKFIVEKKGGNS